MKTHIILIINILFFSSQTILSQTTGLLTFRDSGWSSIPFSYPPGTNNIFLQVEDIDKNLNPNVIDTIHIIIFSQTDVAGELLVLQEINNNSNIFRASIQTQITNAINQDGVLQVTYGDSLIAVYYDNSDDFGNPKKIQNIITFWTLSGLLSENLVMLKSNSPYIISGDLELDGYKTLTIESGVVIKFLPNSGLNCGFAFGSIIIKGTNEEPIVFTSFGDSVFPGEWRGIYTHRQSLIRGEWFVIEGALYGISSTGSDIGSKVYVKNAEFRNNVVGVGGTLHREFKIDHCKFINNQFYGIGVGQANPYLGVDDTMFVSNSLISNNGQGGIHISDGGYLIASHCIISENDGYGISISNTPYETNGLKIRDSKINDNLNYDVFNDSKWQLDSKNNYWGDYTTNEILAGGNPKNLTMLFDIYDNSNKGFVNYGAWRLSPDELLPLTPILTFPEHKANLNATDIVLFWSENQYVQNYTLEISTDSLFTNVFLIDSMITTNHFTLGGLEPNTSYYWKVKAKNIFGESSWTGTRLFNIGSQTTTMINWSAKNIGITNLNINTIVQNIDSSLYIGTGGGGIFRSTDNGDNWTPVNSGISNKNILHLCSNSLGDLFATTSNSIYRSINNAESWETCNNGLPNNIVIGDIGINNENQIYLTNGDNLSGGIYKSIDSGQSWTQILEYFGYCFAFKTNYDFIGDVGVIHRSTNYGATWSDHLLIYGLNQYPIIHLFADRSGYLYASTENEGVFRSTDNAESWIKIEDALPSNFITTSFCTNDEGHLFAGTFGNGIFRSLNNGISWSNISASPLNNSIKCLVMNSHNEIFVGTSNGVFVGRTFPTGVANDVNTKTLKYDLSNAYPNPFNPITHLEFTVSVKELVSIKVFDVLGKEIATLINEEKNPGKYSLNFNASQLSSGIYLYRMQAGDFVQTRKMILLK